MLAELHTALQYGHTPGYFILKLCDACDVELDIKPQLSVSGAIDMIFLQLFPKRFVPIHPTRVAIFTKVLQTKIINLGIEKEAKKKNKTSTHTYILN